jgi:hypothetical protein
MKNNFTKIFFIIIFLLYIKAEYNPTCEPYGFKKRLICSTCEKLKSLISKENMNVYSKCLECCKAENTASIQFIACGCSFSRYPGKINNKSKSRNICFVNNKNKKNSIRESGVPERLKNEGKNFNIKYVKGKVPHFILTKNKKVETVYIDQWNEKKITNFVNNFFEN